MGNNHKLVDENYIDWKKVKNHLHQHIDNLPDGTMEIEKFTEGYSNLTYLVKLGNWEGILRRPPFGKIPPRAHDMKREYDILSKLNPYFPYAPKPYIYCDDEEVMDKHFYVMERKKGYVIDDRLPESYGSSIHIGEVISRNMVDKLVELQEIDYEQAGLSDFGRPEGYLERQVYGWIKRYDLSKTEQFTVVEELEQWFKQHIPSKSEATIVHNDFKINNVVFDKEKIGQIIGILDWELSTIGDPLTDFGSMVAYWGEDGDPDMGVNIITDLEGFYNRRELVEAYAIASHRTLDSINYYVSFGFYKLAVILQQIYYRWKIGELKDDRFADLNYAISNLFEMANQAKNNELI